LKDAVILYNEVVDATREEQAEALELVDIFSDTLAELGYNPHRVVFSLDINSSIEKLKSIKPDFVFNHVESIAGKDELLYFSPAILDMLNIPYTGAGLEAMFITTNKPLTKKRLREIKVNTADWYNLDETDRLDRNKKYILKPLWNEGSLGLDEDCVFTGSDRSFIEKIKNIKNRNSHFIEEFIEGREFNISVLGGKVEAEVLPPAEIIFRGYPEGKPRMVGYNAKWNKDSYEYNNTPRNFTFVERDKHLLDNLRKICADCWREFGLKGYARVDFRVDKNNVPYVLEINANPCISPDAGFVAASEMAGLTYRAMIKRIIDDI
jgi:D-alanine-D-alanine ligase